MTKTLTYAHNTHTSTNTTKHCTIQEDAITFRLHRLLFSSIQIQNLPLASCGSSAPCSRQRLPAARHKNTARLSALSSGRRRPSPFLVHCVFNYSFILVYTRMFRITQLTRQQNKTKQCTQHNTTQHQKTRTKSGGGIWCVQYVWEGGRDCES